MRRRNVGTKTRGRKKCILGVRQSLLAVQREQDGATSIVSDPTTAREAGSGQRKQSLPTNHVQRSCDGGRQLVEP